MAEVVLSQEGSFGVISRETMLASCYEAAGISLPILKCACQYS